MNIEFRGMENMQIFKVVEDIKKYVVREFGAVDKTRMLSRLVDNQDFDSWMTYELMEAALRKLSFDDVELKENMCRDNATSTTATELNLVDSEADKYYNFQSIRVDQNKKAVIRHQNRPDGMFNLRLSNDNEMVIFYEGDAHDRDQGKTEAKGCKNAHKMYQYMVQAQSLNKKSSGCAVFAAMKNSPTDEINTFIEDMFKAHMFACILIIQHNMYQRKTANTILEDVMQLDTKKKYDFVIGINIKSLPTNEEFNTADFDVRVNSLLRELKKLTNIAVVLNFNGQTQVELPTWDYNLGCLNITCFAVPRAPYNFLATAARVDHPFVYPMHLSHVVKWKGDKGKLDTATIRNLFQVYVKGSPFQTMELDFINNMMKVTKVYTQSNAATGKKNSCKLDDTTGFFYLALPLGYFTVQQFECLVNRRLNYNWTSKPFAVKKMVYDLMVQIKGVPTLPVPVMMFKEKENSLLQIICKNIDEHKPSLTDEFTYFLRDGCKWEECPPHSSPAIFFRSLGIFSLQNAIDFACEVKNNQSATYTTVLSTYPVGSQIIIKQCMKKLSTNEAYGYVHREKKSMTSSKFEEQCPSDQDEEDDPASIIDRIHQTISYVTQSFQVTKSNKTDSNYDNWSGKMNFQARNKRLLQERLIKNYRESLGVWYIRPLKYNRIKVVDADRDDNNILRQAFATQFATENEIYTASGVNLLLYNCQLRIDVTTDNDDDEVFVFCKPKWPTDMTMELPIGQHSYLVGGYKIYARFDDETILCFECEEKSSLFSSKIDPRALPSPKREDERRVKWDIPSLHASSLSDTNDIYL